MHKFIVVLGNLIAVLWIACCISYLSRTIGIETIPTLSPTQVGLALLGILSVPGMIWMGLGYFAALRRLERANRIMARQFRDFTKFSADERQSTIHSSEAARHESLTLFEAAQASLGSLSRIQSSMRQNMLALIDAAGKSTEAIDSVGKQMDHRVAAMRGLTGEFHSNSDELQRRVSDVDAVFARISSLQSQGAAIEDAIAKLQSVSEKMQAFDSVAHLSFGAATRFEQAAERIHTGLDGVRNNIDYTNGSIERYAEIGDRLQRITHETQSGLGGIEHMAGTMAEAWNRIRTEQDATKRELEAFSERSQVVSSNLETFRTSTMGSVSELAGVADKIETVFGGVNQKASEINFAVSTAVNRLAELARGLQAARATIDDTTNGAAGKMTEIAVAMQAEFGGIHDVADKALAQLQRTLASVASTSANLDSETQTLEQRIANTFRAAEAGSAQFNRQMSEALDQIGRAEQSFADGQIRIAGTAKESATHLLQLTAALVSGGAELGKAAMVTSERIVAASGVVESRLQSVNEVADQARSVIGAFATELGSATEQGDAFTQQMTDRSAVLRDNVGQIARSAEEAATSVKATTEMLLNTAMEISDTAGKTRTEIVRATAELKREGAAIAETEAESRALAGQVAALLGERAMEMARNARTMAAETITLREMGAKAQRETFLASANTVMHALTSLSVDIAQVLDTDLPEELRLELVRGDIPNFVRRLASLRETVPVPQLRTKFATDTRFRNHVQSYLGQYESLLADAAKVDGGTVLSSALATSDVGKIYTFLSAAIGTERDDLQQTA